MLKRKLYMAVILSLTIFLAACSAVQIPGVKANSTQAVPNSGAGNYDPSRMPLEQKLSIGTLRLEGTNLAVTAAQANQLLPLWNSIKTLNANANSNPADVTAVYKQIEGVLTSDQTQAIQQMTWTQQDLQAMATKYGVQFGSGQPGPTLTADQRATRTAQFQSRSQTNGGQSGTTTAGTTQPGQGGRRGGSGMNNLFVDPLIKLLQTRAAGQ